MNTPATRATSWRSGLIAGAVMAALGMALLLLPATNVLKRLSYDLPFSLRSNIQIDDVILVLMDDRSMREFGQSPTLPWDRAFHANLLMHLKPARAVVFDIFFGDPTERDPLLAAAIQSRKGVVLAGITRFIASVGVEGISVHAPQQKFQKAAAGWGVANLNPDRDQVVRRVQARVEQVPSLPEATAMALDIPLARTRHTRWLNYYGPPGTIPAISYVDALQSPEWRFENKVVFVGAALMSSNTGAQDSFLTPYSRWTGGRSPGVELQATAFLNLARGDWLTETSFPLELGLIILSGLALGTGLARLRPWPAFGATVAIIVTVAATSVLLVWQFHLWFPWLIVCAVQAPCALLWTFLSSRHSTAAISSTAAPPRPRAVEYVAHPVYRPGGSTPIYPSHPDG